MSVDASTNQPRGDRIFIVVAAYNEAAVIRDVIAQLRASQPNVIVVDDASTDGSAERLAGLDVHLLRHTLNRGQGASLQTGIDFAVRRGADVIVTFDADGQHDPDDIPGLIAPIVRGKCDVCLGSRFLGETENMPRARWLTLKAGILFTRVFSGVKTTDVHNGLRALSREAAGSIQITMDRMAHASEILDQIRANRLRFQEVPVKIRYSQRSLEKGQSSWAAIRIALQIFHKKLSP